VRDAAGIGRFQRHVADLLGYLEHNQGALVHYAARRRRGEAISTTFVESAVNEIVAKRMNKAQQMRWNRATVQPFLDVRTAVLNDTLEDAFRQRYPGFRPANDDQALPEAPRFCMLSPPSAFAPMPMTVRRLHPIRRRARCPTTLLYLDAFRLPLPIRSYDTVNKTG
jgi:hypothetical protein